MPSRGANNMSHKHHHKQQQRATAALPAEELEHKAQAALESGRWRQARDFFKLLCKQDRAKYLPGLIQANRGLAEDLMAKGQFSEAEQVLAHLRTLAPPEDLAGIEIQGAIRAQNWSAALPAAVQLWKTRGNALNEQDRQIVADALVLAFPQTDGEGSAVADLPEPVRGELTSVLGALRAVSEQRYDQTQELLRPLGRSSIFAAWKTLIKSWIAFYTGDREKARTLAAMLPADSVPGRAAAPIRALAEPKLLAGPQTPERDQAVVGVCRFLGAPEMAGLLVQADELWKAGKHEESLKLMRRAREFPSHEATLVGAVSEFYYRAGFVLRGAAQDKYFTALERLVTTDSLKNGAEKFLAARALASDALKDPYGSAEPYWRQFLKQFDSDPRRAKIASLALEQVAVQLARQEEEMMFGFGGSRRRDDSLDAAIELLKESLELDPENLSASLKLLDLYELTDALSEGNRLLDEMTRRFPDEKAVLLRAGRQCAERKAYVKGLEYLERARRLDPLDSEIKSEIVLTRIDQARQQYEKKQTEKARATFQTLAESSIDSRLDVEIGRDFLRTRQAVLEMLFGDKSTGEELIAQARQITKTLPALLMFAHGCYCVYQKKPGFEPTSPFWPELKKMAPSSREERMDLLLVFEYVSKLKQELGWIREADLISSYLEPLAREAFDAAEVVELVPILVRLDRFGNLARRMVDTGLRDNPRNTRFRCMDLILQPTAPLHRRAEIEQLRRDALSEGDQATVRTTDEMLSLIDDLAPLPIPGDEFDEDGDEDDDLFDEPLLPGDLPMDEIEEMRREAEKMSDAEFAAFRKQSAKLIPLPIFDILIGKRPKPGKKE